MENKYTASYLINGGVTRLGGVSSDSYDDSKDFLATDDSQAFYLATWYAHYLAMEHLSGTDGKTVVSLQSLKRPDYTEVDQRKESLLLGEKKGVSRQQLEDMVARDLPDGKTKITFTWLDHVLNYETYVPQYQKLGFLAVTRP